MGEVAHRYDETLPLEYRTQESRLNILGFWIFLGAEVALFATLFATYLVLFQRTGSGPTASELFEVKDVLIETLLLLTSSFTCGLAIFEMRRGRLAGLLAWLLVTLLLGAGFIAFEIREFIHYVHEGATMQTSAFLIELFRARRHARRPRQSRNWLDDFDHHPAPPARLYAENSAESIYRQLVLALFRRRLDFHFHARLFARDGDVTWARTAITNHFLGNILSVLFFRSS